MRHLDEEDSVEGTSSSPRRRFTKTRSLVAVEIGAAFAWGADFLASAAVVAVARALITPPPGWRSAARSGGSGNGPSETF